MTSALLSETFPNAGRRNLSKLHHQGLILLMFIADERLCAFIDSHLVSIKYSFCFNFLNFLISIEHVCLKHYKTLFCFVCNCIVMV